MQRMVVQQSEPGEMNVGDSMRPTWRRQLGEVSRSTKWLRGLVAHIGMHQHLLQLPPQPHQRPLLQCQTLLTLRRSTMLFLPPIGDWWRTYNRPLNVQSAWKPSERRQCHAAEVAISSVASVCSALSFALPAEPQCHWLAGSDA